MSEIENTHIATTAKSIILEATRDDITLETTKGDINIRSHEDLDLRSETNSVNLSAKHCINITSEEKSLNLKSHCGKIDVDAKKPIRIKSSHGCVTIKSDREDVNIESYDDVDIKAKEGCISIEAPKGAVNIVASNNVNVTPGENGNMFIEGHLHAVSVYQGKCESHGLLVPIGTLTPFAGHCQPAGWLMCDGSSYCKTRYCDLYRVIGTTFGGCGNTFNVPDLRGRLPLGASQGLCSISDKSVGNTGGSETHQLTVEEIPSHTHTYQNQIGGWESSAYSVSGAPQRPYYSSDTLSTSSTGGNAAHSIMQPYLALNFIIKY